MSANPPSGQHQFIPTLRRIVEAHLTDAAFDVARFVRLTGMSRTDLHRKLTRHTGLSASAFVRYWRVQRAKELLLQHPDWCVCWVGYEVGFSSPSYFTRVFTEVEGVGPAAFRGRKLQGRENLEHM